MGRIWIGVKLPARGYNLARDGGKSEPFDIFERFGVDQQELQYCIRAPSFSALFAGKGGKMGQR
jgi:hypothetical protein